MTDAQFIAWLASSSRINCVLVEVVPQIAGVDTTLYLSNTGYVTGPADAPANQSYLGAITGGGTVSSELSLTLGGGGSLAFGALDIDNTDGLLNGWPSYVWHNREIRIYWGDQRWARADFRQVFAGVIDDLDASDRLTLTLLVRDKLQRLNTAVSDTKLGGATANADRLLPLSFGEMHNVSPLFTGPPTLTYQVHNGPIERIIEVRDNGEPVSRTDALAGGQFSLDQQSFGVVTVSVQGDKPAGVYSNSAAALIQRLVTGYGSDPFVAGDLDAANLAAFDAAHPQPIGFYLPDRDNVLSVCQQIAASVGAQMVISELNKLQLLQVALPAPGGVTPTLVSPTNMAEQTLTIASRPPVQPAVCIGFCKNWTVQPNLQTGIPEEHKQLFATEWITSTASDAAVAATYLMPQQPEQQDTWLQCKPDADAEAARRLAIWKVPRTVYRYDGMPELMLEQLGGYQTITHPRFAALGGSVTGQIVSIERDWLNSRITFGVLV